MQKFLRAKPTHRAVIIKRPCSWHVQESRLGIKPRGHQEAGTVVAVRSTARQSGLLLDTSATTTNSPMPHP